ncbi:hypothetical protein [Rubritalea sp.]
MDPALGRETILQWWYYTSAKSLLENYKKNTKARGTSGFIKDFKPSDA